MLDIFISFCYNKDTKKERGNKMITPLFCSLIIFLIEIIFIIYDSYKWKKFWKEWDEYNKKWWDDWYKRF